MGLNLGLTHALNYVTLITLRNLKGGGMPYVQASKLGNQCEK